MRTAVIAVVGVLLAGGAAGQAPSSTAAVVAAVPAPGVPPQGHAAACPPREPRIEVALADPEPPLSHDITIAGLNALAGNPQSGGQHRLGVTLLRSGWRGEMQLRFAADPGGAICAVVSWVRVTLVHAEHRILIARELPAGTCLYQEVERHERGHVAANRRALRDTVAPARRALQAWAGTAEVRAANPEAARTALQEGLKQAMAPVMAALAEQIDAANRAIDSPEEYRRFSGSCAIDQIRLRDRLRNP